MQFACVRLMLPLALPREKLLNVFYCNRESHWLAVETQAVTHFLFFGIFHFISFWFQAFIHLIQHLSVVLKKKRGCMMFSAHTLSHLTERSGITSLFSYQHWERIRCVQEEFGMKLLNGWTGGGTLYRRYLILKCQGEDEDGENKWPASSKTSFYWTFFSDLSGDYS